MAGGHSDDDDGDYEEALEGMYKKAKKLPGQLEHCEICSKRFTVTPYSKSGPDGGLLCAPCGKVQAKEDKANVKRAPAPRRKRKMESDRLDQKALLGAKTLSQLCIEKVAKHHDDIEELGELPDNVLQRLGEIFGKSRVLNSRTMKFFLSPDLDQVIMNDAACE